MKNNVQPCRNLESFYYFCHNQKYSENLDGIRNLLKSHSSENAQHKCLFPSKLRHKAGKADKITGYLHSIHYQQRHIQIKSLSQDYNNRKQEQTANFLRSIPSLSLHEQLSPNLKASPPISFALTVHETKMCPTGFFCGILSFSHFLLLQSYGTQ